MNSPDDHLPHLSIIIPALNEANSLKAILPELARMFPNAEILVVNDGSHDDTNAICQTHQCRIISNPYRMGNGAAIKRGVRAARSKTLAMLDADGQHSPSDLERLWQRYHSEDLDMLVGARDPATHASLFRRIGNSLFNKLASWMTNQKIEDLTSGMRIVNAHRFREFLHLLPNGFSYPTKIGRAHV